MRRLTAYRRLVKNTYSCLRTVRIRRDGSHVPNFYPKNSDFPNFNPKRMTEYVQESMLLGRTQSSQIANDKSKQLKLNIFVILAIDALCQSVPRSFLPPLT